MRLKIIRLTIVALFLLIASSLIYTQAFRGQYFYTLSKNNRIRVLPIEGRRGRIFDRNGVAIADNRVSFDVMIVPQEIKNQGELFAFLGSVLAHQERKLIEYFHQQKNTPFTPVAVARDIKRDEAVVIEENKFRFPGLFIQARSQRVYPFNEINAHLLGYIGKINRSRITQLKDYGYSMQNVIGYSGVEEFYDQYLKGEDGGLQIEVNSRGRQVRLLGLKDSKSGQDITLTIDNRIQKTAVDVLGGRRGAIIVMDLNNGEILSMVSSPTFDPEVFLNRKSSKKILRYLHDRNAPLLNRAISGVFPAGSVFKIPVAIGALETKSIDTRTTFHCPGFYKLGRRQFRCSHVHGDQNLTEGIAHSCNVYFYNTGLLLGPEKIAHYARLLGLGELTNIDLPYEAKGNIPDKKNRKNRDQRPWSKGDTLNMSIGQGEIQITPLQLVMMMAKVARKGKGIYPHVIKSIGGIDVEQTVLTEESGVDESTFQAVLNGIRAAVGDYAGTARVLDLEDIPVSGKTGTAQTSGGKNNHAWFVGFTSSEKMNIVFCIFLEHGGSSYNACQVTKDLLVRLREDNIL